SRLYLAGLGAPTILDPQIAAVRPTQLLQRVAEHRDARLDFTISLGKHDQRPDAPNTIALLRPRRRRRCNRCRRAGDKYDEFPSPHGGPAGVTGPTQPTTFRLIAAQAAIQGRLLEIGNLGPGLREDDKRRADLPTPSARQNELIGRRQVEARLDAEQRRDAGDDGAADRH